MEKATSLRTTDRSGASRRQGLPLCSADPPLCNLPPCGSFLASNFDAGEKTNRWRLDYRRSSVDRRRRTAAKVEYGHAFGAPIRRSLISCPHRKCPAGPSAIRVIVEARQMPADVWSKHHGRFQRTAKLARGQFQIPCFWSLLGHRSVSRLHQQWDIQPEQWRLRVRCVRVILYLRKIFDRAAFFPATPAMHQTLMQGSKRSDGGCTIVDPP